jgi:hypothetical protein
VGSAWLGGYASLTAESQEVEFSSRVARSGVVTDSGEMSSETAIRSVVLGRTDEPFCGILWRRRGIGRPGRIRKTMHTTAMELTLLGSGAHLVPCAPMSNTAERLLRGYRNPTEPATAVSGGDVPCRL